MRSAKEWLPIQAGASPISKVVPDPPYPVFVAHEDLSFEDALLYTASLLDSASATALDCGELLQSPERAKILAVWHLLEIAKTTVDRSIECLTCTKATA